MGSLGDDRALSSCASYVVGMKGSQCASGNFNRSCDRLVRYQAKGDKSSGTNAAGKHLGFEQVEGGSSHKACLQGRYDASAWHCCSARVPTTSHLYRRTPGPTQEIQQRGICSSEIFS